MRKLWIVFALVLLVSFSVLGWIGTRIYQEAPPIVNKVVTTEGKVVIDAGEIQAGQNVWQTLGGMEVGSIWGHGSYVAPDWTADWLHREAIFILNRWAKSEFGKEFENLDHEKQSQLSGRLATLMRTNTYDPATQTVTVAPVRADAFEANLAHYSDVFANGKTDYAIPAGAVTDPVRLHHLSAFYFWTAWASSTNRPDDHISYTNNWPYEPLVANRATGEAVVWTGVSIIMLLAGISAMGWWYASRREAEKMQIAPETDPLGSWQATPSQKATVKYFWVVSALILLQMLLGVITAHYGVEGDAFYGFPLSKWLPYSVARTWHVQLGLFWIATAWLAAGLFIGPLVSEKEPKGQRFGVNVLFLALLLVVGGSLTGEWLSIHNKMTDAVSFYFGHQGYEYVDLGRAWQMFIDAKGIKATGYEDPKGFVVLKGSQLVKDAVPSIHAYMITLRNDMLEQGVISANGNAYVFNQDYVFNSSSTAAGVIQGRTANGRKDWKNKEGKTLREIQEAAADNQGPSENV